jgi:hypothetical protein
MAGIDSLELRAGAAAASVLGAKLLRRDIPGAHQTRDFDLLLGDGSVEPLEITRYVDEPALRTWERLRGATPLRAPSLSRVWVLAIPPADVEAGGTRVAYDVRKFVATIESALAALEAAGHQTINLGRVQVDPALANAFRTLVDLGVQDGYSRAPAPGQTAYVSFGAPVGGFTQADLVASAIEREASKADNQRKLAQPPSARRRHLFLVFDGSSGSFFNAVDRGLQGRLPRLPAPITTGWAAARGFVLVTTPPNPWQQHALPQAVFDAPETWLA